MVGLSTFSASRSTTRAAVGEFLRTATELDAFLIDYFPEVHQKHGVGMDRTATVNLLLELIDAQRILYALYQHLAEDPNAQSRLLSLAKGVRDHGADKPPDEELERLVILRERRRMCGQDVGELDRQIGAHKQRMRHRPTLRAEQVLAERYKLLEPIGQGGFARVWQAFDRHLERLVAVRILHSDWADEDERVRRFLRGAKWMQRLQHSCIARVVGDPGWHEGFHFFAMEYLPGGSLDRALPAGTITREEAMHALLDVGSALEYIHKSGLVHRDVKPSNILLDAERRARLTDFDLVLTADSPESRTGPLGTLLFAAPEALEDAQIADQRTDIYSLGMTAAYIYHGRKPPTSRLYDPRSFIRELECPESVRVVLHKATDQNPNERWSNVREFCDSLAQAMNGSAAVATEIVLSAGRRSVPSLSGARQAPGWRKRVAQLSLLAGLVVIPQSINDLPPPLSRMAGNPPLAVSQPRTQPASDGVQPEPSLQREQTPPWTPPQPIESPAAMRREGAKRNRQRILKRANPPRPVSGSVETPDIRGNPPRAASPPGGSDAGPIIEE